MYAILKAETLVNQALSGGFATRDIIRLLYQTQAANLKEYVTPARYP